MSKSTVRTIMLAPAPSRILTHARSPSAAAMCSAVSPFSALLSTYLRECSNSAHGSSPQGRSGSWSSHKQPHAGLLVPMLSRVA